MNKKTIIVVFFSLILISAPLAATAREAAIEKNETLVGNSKDTNLNVLDSEEDIRVPLSEEDIKELEPYMNHRIVRQVVTNENEVDMQELANVIDQEYDDIYGDTTATTDIVDDIINLLIRLIRDRLGWVYEAYSKASNILSSAQYAINAVTSLPGEIKENIQDTVDKIIEVKTLMLHLIKLEFRQFLSKWSPGIMIQDIQGIITNFQNMYGDIISTINAVKSFVNSVDDFITWFNSNPWTQDILITGQTFTITKKGVSSVTVSSRGQSVSTGANGEFSFYVNSDAQSDSVPTHCQLGLHNCQITASKGNTQFTSLLPLSYSFAGGTIEYDFYGFIDDSKDNDIKSHILNNMFNRENNIFSFLDLLFNF